MSKSSEAKMETTIVRPSGFTPTPLPWMSRARSCQTKAQTPDHYHRRVRPRTDPRHVPLSRLKPAVPSIDRSTVWIDTVKRGPMVRQVRGLGTLVPEDIRWIAANTEGRVEKIIVWPGTHGEARHGHPGIDQPGARTGGRRRGIESQSGGSGTDHLARDFAARAARPGIDHRPGSFRIRTGEDGAPDQRPACEKRPRLRSAYKTSKVKEAELANRDEIEQKRLDFSRDSIEPQIAVKQAAVDQAKEFAKLKADQVERCMCKAGMTGVLQQLPVQIGQRVTPETTSRASPIRPSSKRRSKSRRRRPRISRSTSRLDRHAQRHRGGPRHSGRSRGGTGHRHGRRGARRRAARKARVPISASTERSSWNVSIMCSTSAGRLSARRTTPSAFSNWSPATSKRFARR